MDREGRPKLLSDLNLAQTFDCGLLANRSFIIKEKDALIPGAGQDGVVDKTGYLSETLSKIHLANSVKTSCIAAHADPDGHCLGIPYMIFLLYRIAVRTFSYNLYIIIKRK